MQQLAESIKSEIVLWERKIKERISGKRKKFCHLQKKIDFEKQTWHSHLTSQPIIKPTGQEDIFNNKIHNINLVIDRINFLEIRPGEIFSFWHLVGRPIAKRGFKPASIFINNKVEKQTGGGICQISTALYSAALHFGLEVIERHTHSIDAYSKGRYFKLGQDATASFPRQDLQFRNNFADSVFLFCQIKNQRMEVRLYSKENFCQTKVESKILKVIPFEVEIIKNEKITEREDENQNKVIQTGSEGKIVETFREIKLKNGNSMKELVSKDYYKPMSQIENNTLLE